MAAGRSIGKGELNTTWGNLAAQAFTVMAQILEAKAVLDGYSSAQLVSLFGFASGDADILKSAATDLGDWAAIFSGTTSTYLSGTHDYRVFAKQLLGPGIY